MSAIVDYEYDLRKQPIKLTLRGYKQLILRELFLRKLPTLVCGKAKIILEAEKLFEFRGAQKLKVSDIFKNHTF